MDQNDNDILIFYTWYGDLQTGGLEKYFYILLIVEQTWLLFEKRS
jgi:hypothetical protein